MMNLPLSKRVYWLKISLIITLFVSTLTLTTSSCKTTDQERQAAKIAKEEKKKKRQAQKDYEKAHKRHMDIQDKKTRKRMKGNKTKMMDQTYVKKKSFWQRLFKKKDKTCPKS